MADPAHRKHPALVALENAPKDDEPVTPADVAAIAEAREEVRRGKVLSQAEVRALWLDE